MSQADKTTTIVHPDALELAALLRPEWPAIDHQLRLSGVPLNEGEDGGEGGADDGAGGEGAGGNGEPKVYDEAYVKALRNEAAGHRTKANDLQTKLTEIEDRDKTEQQKAADRAEAAEKRAADAEAKVLRADVAADKGVPAKLAKFLTGSTKEELEKAADELLAELGNKGGTSFDGGADRGNGAAGAGDIDSAIRRAAGRT